MLKSKENRPLRLCILSTFLLIFFYEIRSQIVLSVFQDTSLKKNYISQIFDKQFNIYRLSSSLSFAQKFSSFNVSFLNDYEGFIIRGNEISKKDQEKLFLEVDKSLFHFLDLSIQSNYLFNSDTKTIGLYEAEKINGSVGLVLKLPPISKVLFTYGMEKIKQVSIEQYGPRLSLGANVENFNIIDVNLNSKLFLEEINLKDGRKNSNIFFNLKFDGQFEENNSLFISLDYSNLRRDYIVYPIYLDNFFETRKENRLFPTFGLSYNLFGKTYVNFTGQLNLFSINRYYNLFDPTNQYSAIERTLLEQSTEFNIELFAENKYFSPRFGLNYYLRNEENTIDKKYEIDNQTFSQLASTELQKNNFQNRLRLFYNFVFRPSKNNLTFLNGNLSILRYDTPSQLNDDDRDEFSFLTTLSTIQKFSEYYTLSISFDIQLNHLVFLKSTKSSLNNWNRIIKLTASSQYNTEFFLWKPNLEIYSNYLVYDFEVASNSTKSFAFRQFVYRDSLELFFSNIFMLSSILVYKFSERGKLFWNTFSMTKELGIKEFFMRALLYVSTKPKLQFGFGARIYNIKQVPLGKSSFHEEYSYYSFSPETEIKVFLGKDKVIFLQGWYELKFWNYKIAGENPNLILTTKVAL
ncbi:MAG: hypothetical protein N2560_02195 [Ignavibacteria bacterium]|nr:hypothetical protein [Ignavibacteria bacterium]